MKIKFLTALLLISGISTLASSEECLKEVKNQNTCNKVINANVSASKDVVSFTDDELSPLSLLIFQI